MSKNGKTGRPRGPRSAVKVSFLRVRLTREQRATLQAAAITAGLDVSSWLRSVGLKAAEGALP